MRFSIIAAIACISIASTGRAEPIQGRSGYQVEAVEAISGMERRVHDPHYEMRRRYALLFRRHAIDDLGASASAQRSSNGGKQFNEHDVNNAVPELAGQAGNRDEEADKAADTDPASMRAAQGGLSTDDDIPAARTAHQKVPPSSDGNSNNDGDSGHDDHEDKDNNDDHDDDDDDDDDDDEE
ncbi:hypothetical protein EC973_003940 [Apophysomyces ossiformis]|uniref:Uncharacterized protein n=1 Tax=Apophysomyces ossiformis TaxID=679940 RepID=A0A8H7BKT4_9FUNG|nr:hypothetical protein EC973_003940 [Apophysomyces ossiformis]